MAPARKGTTFTAGGFRMRSIKSARTCSEVWLEKDALAGVVVDVTAEYDVPLMVRLAIVPAFRCREHGGRTPPPSTAPADCKGDQR